MGRLAWSLMPKSVPVSQIMTSQVRTLGPDATLDEVRRLLRSERCHHVPIVEGGRLVGIVSSRDLLRRMRASESADPTGIEAVMSRDVVTLRRDESVDRAIDLIADGHLHSVLVVDDDGGLAGIVTDTDLLAYLG